MANIAEGQGRRTDRDFAQFLNIAQGSVAESKSHMYLAMNLG
jgi:four helix bundle protein